MSNSLKILVTEEQSLDEIINILNSLGYKLTFKLTDNPDWVTVNLNYKSYGFFDFNPESFHSEVCLEDLITILGSD